MKTFLVSSFLLLVVLAACADKEKNTDVPLSPPVVHGATKLLGQWNGPEGTYLLIAGTSGKYAITIKNLDGARTFEATGLGDAITFERDGKLHTLRATDGAATGMKWLSDKKNCVTIEAGEGYCRE